MNKNVWTVSMSKFWSCEQNRNRGMDTWNMPLTAVKGEGSWGPG